MKASMWFLSCFAALTAGGKRSRTARSGATPVVRLMVSRISRVPPGPGCVQRPCHSDLVENRTIGANGKDLRRQFGNARLPVDAGVVPIDAGRVRALISRRNRDVVLDLRDAWRRPRRPLRFLFFG